MGPLGAPCPVTVQYLQSSWARQPTAPGVGPTLVVCATEPAPYQMASARSTLATVHVAEQRLLRAAAVSLVLLVVAIVGLVVDDRIITAVPAWLKPAKFSASAAVYLFTMAYMVRELPRSRTLTACTTLIGWILVLEIAVIAVQAARGRTSHFNIDTALDATLFTSMGVGIGVLWILSAIVLVLHCRTRAPDRAMAIALRLGLALNIVAAGVGWTMTQPRPAQLDAMRRNEHPFVAGSHTIGAPDGGAGLPGVYWSRDHGDLRVPHFLGMHAWQLLPLLLLGIRKVRTRRDDATEQAAIVIAAVICAAIFVAAFLQAIAGHPLFPTSPT